MALLNLYSVRDSKIGVFGKPFCESSDVQATRALNIAVNDPNVQLSHFPEDFDLYKLGSFDEESGKVVGFEAVFVVAALSQQRLSAELDRIASGVAPDSKLLSGRRLNENVQPLQSPGK